VLLGTAVATTSHDAPGASDHISEVQSCALDGDALGVPIVQITAAWFDSLLATAAGFSEAQLARIDSVYGTGHLGLPGTEQADRAAHLLSRLRTVNTYRHLALLCADTTRVYEANESVLADGIARYSDASLICTIRAQRVRFGLGHACVRYDLSDAVQNETMLGGKHVPYRVKDDKVQGLRRRVLSLDLPTGTGGTVEVLLASHYTFEFRYVRSDGPPAPYEWFLVHDIRGGWLRKWGTHHPTAFMFWTTPMDSAATDMPPTPLVGVRIYIPNLTFKLPLILPDFDLDDLREIELPQPILRMAYLREHRSPRWLHTDPATLGFGGWGGHGAVPKAIRERFPH
jgi:hypothetical protein